MTTVSLQANLVHRIDEVRRLCPDMRIGQFLATVGMLGEDTPADRSGISRMRSWPLLSKDLRATCRSDAKPETLIDQTSRFQRCRNGVEGIGTDRSASR